MNNLFKIIPFLICAISFAQENEVNLETVNNRTLEKSYRISERPKMIDTVTPAPTVEYPLLSIKKETSVEIASIDPAKVRINNKLDQLYKGYAKIGVGSTFMTLGEFYYASERSRKFHWGIDARHISSWASIKGYAPSIYDRTRSNLFGQINQKKYTLKGNLHYNNLGFGYYGFKNENAKRDSISQRYSDFGINGLYASHNKDSAELNYTIGLTYNNFLSAKPKEDSLSKWRAHENFIGINTNWNYKLGKELFAVDLDVLHNRYTYGTSGDTLTSVLDSGLVSNNTIFRLSPTATTHSRNNKFRARAGFDISLDIHNGTKAHIYPILDVKYSLFEDLFIPYAGLSGKLKQNTFKKLAYTNEFINPNIKLDNETEAIKAFVGIKGTLTKKLSFDVNAQFSNNKNKALFIPDTTYSAGNEFAVVYDTINITKIEASLAYQINEKLKIDAIGRYFSYQGRRYPQAWNLPQTQFILRGKYNLFSKFVFNLDCNIETGRNSLVYGTNIAGVKTQDNINYISLGVIADANLGIEYRYNKRISAFLNINNIASQRYKRWSNYQVQAFQVLGGFTFRF